MVRWMRDGTQPPSGPPMEVSAVTPSVVPVRDSFGNIVGGIRLPDFAVPIATDTGINFNPVPPIPGVLCNLYGQYIPFDAATLAELYTSHGDYLLKTAAASSADVSAGYLLYEDAAGANTTAAESDIGGTSLAALNLNGINLMGVALPNDSLAAGNLNGADLSNGNLQGVNLRGANLNGADFAGTNLSGAALQGANLRRANFANADLSRAKLQGANLQVRTRSARTGRTAITPSAAHALATWGVEVVAQTMNSVYHKKSAATTRDQGGKVMRTCVIGLVTALSALVGGASAAHAANTSCTGTLNGSITGNIVVPNGASCTLSDATVTGNVQVQQNASLTIDATQQPTTIGGNVEAINCASALLEGGVTVTGSVQIVQCAQKSGFVGPGVKIGGNFHCINNGGGCEADLGDVQGNVQIVSNNSSAASDISLVSVGGNLQCVGNSPSPTHTFGPDFVAGNLQAQCAANLGFAPTTAAPTCVASTLNVPNVTVTSAALVKASTATVAGGTFIVPEYCQVIGVVATSGECPATGPFAAPSGPNLIGCNTPGSPEFRLKLPLVWNHHFVFEGCGGSCGSITSTSVNTLDAAEALGLGYAVVNTDTGHEQDPKTLDYTWAVSESTPPVVNNSAIIDFYYRAVHQVTVATKQYVEAYYSRPIDYAYFDGCSTGGRQAMVEATHYSVDYDGVIAGDPALAYHSLRTSTFQQAKSFIPTGAWIPYPSAAFPTNPNTVVAVDAAVTASCDAVDGVMDGLIQNAAACNILPSALGPSGSGILTATQQAGSRDVARWQQAGHVCRRPFRLAVP
jgi:hypothetical protein